MNLEIITAILNIVASLIAIIFTLIQSKGLVTEKNPSNLSLNSTKEISFKQIINQTFSKIYVIVFVPTEKDIKSYSTDSRDPRLIIIFASIVGFFLSIFYFSYKGFVFLILVFAYLYFLITQTKLFLFKNRNKQISLLKKVCFAGYWSFLLTLIFSVLYMPPEMSVFVSVILPDIEVFKQGSTFSNWLFNSIAYLIKHLKDDYYTIYFFLRPAGIFLIVLFMARPSTLINNKIGKKHIFLDWVYFLFMIVLFVTLLHFDKMSPFFETVYKKVDYWLTN